MSIESESEKGYEQMHQKFKYVGVWIDPSIIDVLSDEVKEHRTIF